MSILPAPPAADRPAPIQLVPLVPVGRGLVDPARSRVGFEVRHLRVARVRGAFNAFAARVDAGDGLRIDGAVDVASLDTGDGVRDKHLRSAGYFDAARHPEIAYAARGAVPERDGWRIDGELTIRGVTRPLALHATVSGDDDGALRIAAGGELSRRDFGLQWAGLVEAGRLVVSDDVKVVVDAVLVPAGG